MSNWFDSRYTDRHWDHERDLRKHDTPSRHQPAHRLDTQIPTAVEIAGIVKSVSITDGAALIEQYARTKAAEAKLDGIVEGSDKVLQSIEQHAKVSA